uniref:Zinc finger protein 772 n=1 Tax=Suricata suricatta TaxID=37032 RepID=A0A673V4U5_SURSU
EAGEGSGHVNFEDVARLLYRDVMLENLTLMASLGYESSTSRTDASLELGTQPWVSDWAYLTPARTREAQGCWHGAEGEEIAFEQNISVGVSQVRTPKADPSTQKAHPCETCGLLLKDILHSAQHLRTHPGQKSYTCGACGKQFWFRLQGLPTSSSIFQRHAPHSNWKPNSNAKCVDAFHSGQRHYECSECGKVFSRKDSLVQHQRVHTGERPYECGICGKVFNHSSNLIVHQRVHTGARPYKCSECGKAYSHKSTLVQHENIHTGERPYEYSECGKYFGHKYRLIKHWSLHAGARPYECIECGKFFSQSSDLIAHQRVHNGEKPYVCSDCGRAFSYKHVLVQHHRIHTGERPYKCSECGKAFRQRASLIRHWKVHTGERP